jgi:hypothetical protein
MKKSIYASLTSCMLFVLVLAISPASGQQPFAPQPFSADLTETLAKAKQNVSGKMYFGFPKIRMDTSVPGGRPGMGQAIMIIDATKQTMYMLMPQQHMYMEMSGNQQQNPMASRAPKPPSYDPNHPCGPDATCQKAGTETVNGRVCDKYVSSGSSGTTTAWVDQKLHFPIKTLDANGNSWQLSNIQEGQQDASLFEIPAGYTKMDLGSMMGGGRPPQ